MKVKAKVCVVTEFSSALASGTKNPAAPPLEEAWQPAQFVFNTVIAGGLSASCSGVGEQPPEVDAPGVEDDKSTAQF